MVVGGLWLLGLLVGYIAIYFHWGIVYLSVCLGFGFHGISCGLRTY